MSLRQEFYYCILNTIFDPFLQGAKRLEGGFSHRVKTHSRHIAYAADSIVAAYSSVMGDLPLQEHDDVEILYVAEVEFEKQNWDLFSGVKLMIQSGKVQAYLSDRF